MWHALGKHKLCNTKTQCFSKGQNRLVHLHLLTRKTTLAPWRSYACIDITCNLFKRIIKITKNAHARWNWLQNAHCLTLKTYRCAHRSYNTQTQSAYHCVNIQTLRTHSNPNDNQTQFTNSKVNAAEQTHIHKASWRGPLQSPSKCSRLTISRKDHCNKCPHPWHVPAFLNNANHKENKSRPQQTTTFRLW